MTEPSDHGLTILHIAHAATRARRQDLLAAFVRQHGWIVQSGPFTGTILPDITSWGDGDLLPKLIGCYEAELHPTITEMLAARPDIIVNIGAAEGYYAVGMSRLVPEAIVYAFDTDTKSQEICRAAASLNGVANQVSVVGRCTPDLLQAVLVRGLTPLVFCDCEGCERELIDPERVPALRRATLILECHDFIDATITRTLVDRLNASHTMGSIREGARDPNEVPFLRGLNSLDRWLAVCEYRPVTMYWLVAKPKAAVGQPQTAAASSFYPAAVTDR